MIKRHKRTISGGMRRTSRMFLNDVNFGKVAALTTFLHQQANVIRYFTTHHDIKTERYRCLKQMDLSTVKTVVMEDLKYVKHGKRGTFSRKVTRLLSFWAYAQADTWLQQRCQEAGVRVSKKSPAYTSQRCPVCGNIDRRNRRQNRFTCTQCQFEEHADIVPTLKNE